jgi:hypothetical protein
MRIRTSINNLHIGGNAQEFINISSKDLKRKIKLSFNE